MESLLVNSTSQITHINPSQDMSILSSSAKQIQTSEISDPALVAPPNVASSPATTPPQRMMYKNRLQEFAQKSNIALPVYQTTNEGSPHAPRFRASVWVNGMSYTSQNTFSQRKAAEQDVARVALEGQTARIRDDGCPLIFENTLFSKSILNEYATKLNIGRPTYDTIQLEGLLPLFVSTLVFNGTKYTGDAARNKKEAEQLAARAAILSILGNSSSETLYEIIKSKARIYAAVKPNKSECSDAGTVSVMINTEHTSLPLDPKDNDVAGVVVINNSETKIELPEPSKMPSSCQESLIHNHEPSLEATELPNMSLQPGPEQFIGDSSSSKRRRKNKKKANKRSRLESTLPVAAFPMNEIPPCSVTQ